ncbi:hypothetical protein RHMOL_Rhmol05G0174600 [Rhododendron molle]|nr:hypothetical protein RHMOL_Rhmol05G0174600 [Rhododendron molle]
MAPARRKIPDSSPPPALRRSKRLAKCKDVAISVEESTDGRGDEENHVTYSGNCSDQISKSVSQGDTKSDSDGDKDGESESQSDSHSGAIKLPNLSAFAARPVIEERTVALDLNRDKWGKVQISVIGPGTIGKSEGQSKLHREVNNPASLEGLRDMIVTVQENQISMWEKLRRVERAVCPDYDEDEDIFDDD